MKKATPVKKVQAPDLGQVLAELQAQLAAAGGAAGAAGGPRCAGGGRAPRRPPRLASPPGQPRRRSAPAEPSISEEEVLAISARRWPPYLGVRLHIRQIRLLSSPAWAQQGRVSIQASHRLHN